MLRNAMKNRLAWLILLILVGVFTAVQNVPGRALAAAAPMVQVVATPVAASISALLKKADAYFETMYFVSPPGANALEIYQQVLTLDPANTQAQDKIRQMADICKAWGDSAYAQGYQTEAVTFYQRYLQIAQVIAGSFSEAQTQSGIQAVTGRLTELSAAPEQSLNRPTSTASKLSEAQATSRPPAAVVATPTAQSLSGELNQNPLFLPLVGLGGGALVVLLAVGIYLGIIRPQRKLRSLNEALKLISNGAESDLAQAEELVEQAMTSGLDKRSIEEARFAQIYVKARLHKYPEASALMKEFLRKTTPDQETAYLAIWVYFQQKQYDEILQLYGQYRDQLGDLLDAKMIAGIAYLHLGQRHWERREVEKAIKYFDMLRELNVLNEHIPAHTDDYQIVLGITALFDGRVEQAREYFEGANEKAREAGKATFEGDLGLLASEWHEQEYPNIDDDLGKTLATMERIPSYPAQDRSGNLLLRNVRLWYAVSLLFTWYKLPEKVGLPDEKRKEALQRIQLVKALGDKNADADLLEGLITYYFDPNNKERAMQMLKLALEHGVGVPDVINLVQREEKAQEQQRKALDLYLQLIKKYLNDTSVPLDLRQELKSHLNKFSRFQQLDKEIKFGTREDDALPSLQDIQNRGQFLRSRVENIVRTRLAKNDSSKIKGLLTTLNEATNWLTEDKNELEEAEQELMLQTGEFLFQEEEELAEEKEGTQGEVQADNSAREKYRPLIAKTLSPKESLIELERLSKEISDSLEKHWQTLLSLSAYGRPPLTTKEQQQGLEIRSYLLRADRLIELALTEVRQLRESAGDWQQLEQLDRLEIGYRNTQLGKFKKKLTKLGLPEPSPSEKMQTKNVSLFPSTPGDRLDALDKLVVESNAKLEGYWKTLVQTLPADGARPLTSEEAKQVNEMRAYLKQLEDLSQQALHELDQLRSLAQNGFAIDLVNQVEMLCRNQAIWRGDFRRKLRRLNLPQEDTAINSALKES